MKNRFLALLFLAVCGVSFAAQPYTINDTGPTAKEVDNKITLVQTLDGSGNRVNLMGGDFLGLTNDQLRAENIGVSISSSTGSDVIPIVSSSVTTDTGIPVFTLGAFDVDNELRAVKMDAPSGALLVSTLAGQVTDTGLGNAGFGTQRVVLPYDQPAIPTIVAGFTSFSNITTASTTQVKSGFGVLKSVVINSKGTVASTVTIYNATSGTTNKLATIDSLNLSGTFDFDVEMGIGIRVVTTGTIPPDVTVIYR